MDVVGVAFAPSSPSDSLLSAVGVTTYLALALSVPLPRSHSANVTGERWQPAESPEFLKSPPRVVYFVT